MSSYAKKPNSFQHPAYLSEKEICDQLETSFLHSRTLWGLKVFRELRIGSIRPDFIIIHGERHLIEIVEVKLSADVHAVSQLCLYKRIIEEQAAKLSIAAPTVVCGLYSKIFDRSIIEICTALNFNMHRITVSQDKKADLDFVDFYESDCVVTDQNFQNILSDSFKEKNV